MLSDNDELPTTGPAIKFSQPAIHDLYNISHTVDCDLSLLVAEIRYLVSGKDPGTSAHVYRETALFERQFIQGAGLYIWYDTVGSVSLVVEVSSVSDELTPRQLKRWKALRKPKGGKS